MDAAEARVWCCKQVVTGGKKYRVLFVQVEALRTEDVPTTKDVYEFGLKIFPIYLQNLNEKQQREEYTLYFLQI